MGKRWCMSEYGLTEGQVRYTAAQNGLRIKQGTDFWKGFQKRAADGKRGKKYPIHSEHTKKLWRLGILKPHPRGRRNPFWKRVLRVCKQCTQQYETTPSTHLVFCSVNCRKIGEKTQWKDRPHPRGMLGKTHTDEVKKAVSARFAGRRVPSEQTEKAMRTKLLRYGFIVPPGNRHKTTWRSGWREIGGAKYFFRSKWEANYARYLHFLEQRKDIQKWEYEPETFWFENIKRGIRSYLPDFRVTTKNGNIEYHEVKGWMDSRSKTQLNRMRIYHPSIKLIVIDSSQYKSISKYGKVFSQEWE